MDYQGGHGNPEKHKRDVSNPPDFLDIAFIVCGNGHFLPNAVIVLIPDDHAPYFCEDNPKGNYQENPEPNIVVGEVKRD